MEDFRWRGRDRLWWLPLLMLVWVNSHGGFVVGFILWGVYTFDALLRWAWDRWGAVKADTESGRRLVRLLVIGALTLAVVLVNPSGAAMYAYAFKTVGIGALQDYIQEWQSPNFHLLHVQPFAWLLLLTFAAIGASRRRLALTDFLLVAGFAYLGWMAGRNVALFALAAPLALTRHAAPLLAVLGRKLGYHGVSQAPPKSAWLNWIILTLLCLAVIIKALSIYPSAVNQDAFQRTLPIGAVTYLHRHQPAGKLFNSYNWGGYLLWALPEYPVFIDGRTDLYSDEVISEWLQVMRAEAGWQAVLERYGVNLILVENDTLLDRLLEKDQDWNSGLLGQPGSDLPTPLIILISRPPSCNWQLNRLRTCADTPNFTLNCVTAKTINIENKPGVSKRLVGDIIILIECLIAAASQETPDFAGKVGCQ